MASCGGTILFSRVMVESAKATQIVSALESRTKVTIQADRSNLNPVYLLHAENQSPKDGWELRPGDVLLVEDRGSRAAIYARSATTNDTPELNVMVEGA